MKNIQLFLDVFVLVLLVLIHLYRPVTMSHTWMYSWPFRFVVSGFSSCLHALHLRIAFSHATS